MYVCKVITYSKHKDQLGKVTIPARGQLTKESNNSLSPFVPKNLVSRDGFGSPVLRQPAHLHTQAEYGAYLRDSSRFPPRSPFIYFKSPYTIWSVPSLSDLAMRTDGVHRRESAGTGPVTLKVVPVTGATFASSTPAIGVKWPRLDS